MRITAFVANTKRGQLADLELRHRRRAHAEDRIRCTKDTGLANLPLHDFAQNQIWCAIVALAAHLLAWMQTLALTGHDARRWEPKRLRLRLLSIPARRARTGRRRLLHLAATPPFTALVRQGFSGSIATQTQLCRRGCSSRLSRQCGEVHYRSYPRLRWATELLRTAMYAIMTAGSVGVGGFRQRALAMPSSTPRTQPPPPATMSAVTISGPAFSSAKPGPAELAGRQRPSRCPPRL